MLHVAHYFAQYNRSHARKGVGHKGERPPDAHKQATDERAAEQKRGAEQGGAQGAEQKEERAGTEAEQGGEGTEEGGAEGTGTECVPHPLRAAFPSVAFVVALLAVSVVLCFAYVRSLSSFSFIFRLFIFGSLLSGCHKGSERVDARNMPCPRPLPPPPTAGWSEGKHGNKKAVYHEIQMSHCELVLPLTNNRSSPYSWDPHSCPLKK